MVIKAVVLLAFYILGNEKMLNSIRKEIIRSTKTSDYFNLLSKYHLAHYKHLNADLILPILYHDDHLVAINKPHGLMVHRSKIGGNADEFALQILRDQINQYVYPVHRLDRKTSGVLIFALRKEVAKAMGTLYMNNEVHKQYRAIVRGYFPHDLTEIEYALTNDSGKTQEAKTQFKLLQQVEISIPLGKHKTSRYSMIEAYPHTGRMHQIRKHLSHLSYPIVGDRPHGCNKQNRLFKERWQMIHMMLHAECVSFTHPIIQEQLTILAPLSKVFSNTLSTLGFH